MAPSARNDAAERDALLSAEEQQQAAIGTGPDHGSTGRPRRSRREIAKVIALHVLPIIGAAAVLVLFFLLVLPWILHGGRGPPSFRSYPAHLATGYKGAVATENQQCSDIGVSIMRDRGGNAVDAAIAATLCIGVLNMFSAGIGGGGWAIVRAPNPDPFAPKSSWNHTVVDFREYAPGLANETMFLGRPEAAKVGGLAVGVPGELRGLEELHNQWGTLPWADLVEPAASLADEATVSRELARRLKAFGAFMKKDRPWRKVFVHRYSGRLLSEGDAIRRTHYAKTLRTIAKEGPRALYVGPIAQALVRTIKAAGGIMTLTDLAVYRVKTYPALEGTWAGKKVYTTGAPSSGPVLLSLLSMLDGFDQFVPANDTSLLSTFGGAATSGLNSGLGVHRYIEALKFGFGQRTLIGDPEYLSTKAQAAIEEITSPKRIKALRANITDDRTHKLSYYHPLFDITHDHGTMSLSVVDKDGMAVSLTSTVNLIFGSRVMCPETGIILNDEMDDSSTPGVPNAFGLAPSPYNYPDAGKRPLSSMAPAIVEYFEPESKSNSSLTSFEKDGQHVFASGGEEAEHDDDLYSSKKLHKVAQPDTIVALGGSGGSRIFGSIAQVLLHLDSGLDISSAIERPRFHQQLLPIELDVETSGGRFEASMAEELGQRGHQVSYIDINTGWSEVQGVQRHSDGRVWGASDSRKQGVASAY
ncbi:hypothetical protein OC846_003747 [Tilletia horrida]|uniref:Glutathione hydrolase n=1 Tax=Tilletia horrida TaxID=155126 RepID=A0AAN6GRG9_9BASI|nr:hypothetical protein OC845_003593 [Tilletia horrida]KAK0550267.1 hypothetical protein OC846_003747 [Tilletia horrida]KAK0565412.1 hypothetical protein OC861_003782 [Tilletia horrida]